MILWRIPVLMTLTFITPSQANVAFSAELSEDRVLGHDSAIPFDRVLIREGATYIPAFGVFICPDTSWYVFTWTIGAVQGRAQAMLCIDTQDEPERPIKMGPLTGDFSLEASGTSSMTSLLQCTVDAAVFLKAVGYPNSTSSNTFSATVSSFSGFKIFPSTPIQSDMDPTPWRVPPSGFTAQLSADSVYTTGARIVFNTITKDIDGRYDPIVGIFICPADGPFIISVSAHTTQSSYTEAAPTVNGNAEFIFYGPYLENEAALDSGTSTLSMIVDCVTNSEVTIKSESEPPQVTYRGQFTSLTAFAIPFNTSQPDNEIAFSARLSEPRNYDNEQTLIFDDVISNIGDNYFKNHGIFVCPDTGLYVFMWSIYTSSGTGAKVMLGDDMKKMGPVTNVKTNGSSSSMQTVMRCEVEKAVYVRTVVGAGTAQYGAHLTTFSGFRLPDV